MRRDGPSPPSLLNALRTIFAHASVCSALAIVALATAAGCGESPVAPDPRIPPTTGAPDVVRLEAWMFDFTARVTRVRANAQWGYLYSAFKDVTNEARWTVDNASVLSLAAGTLTPRGPGDATLGVEYRGVTTAAHIRVYSGEPPWLVIEGNPSSTYVVGRVRDATQPDTARGIEGVTVEIVDGHNAGRVTTTDMFGQYQFGAPFVCGPVTCRATKAGYATTVASSVMCLGGMPDVRMMPLP
jgi:hypothetical protein